MKRMEMKTKLQKKQEGAQKNGKQSMLTTGNIMGNTKMTKIKLGSAEHRLWLSYQETMDSMMRTINGFYGVIESLQDKVRELELQVDKLTEH